MVKVSLKRGTNSEGTTQMAVGAMYIAKGIRDQVSIVLRICGLEQWAEFE